MTKKEILEIIDSGETSRVQFKKEITHSDSLAAEMIAMANSIGGIIVIGVEDKSSKIIGISNEKIHEYNEKISNIATNNVIPLIYVYTEVEVVDDKKLLLIHVNEGLNKPYKDRNSTIWLKQGADKRKVKDNAEILRLFQKSGTLYIDEMEVYDTGIDDVSKMRFSEFYKKEFYEDLEDSGTSYEQLLKNLNILKNDRLTLGGLMFFGKNPQKQKPNFCVKAVSFVGNEIEGVEYRDSRDLTGTMPELFDKSIAFLKNNLKHIQKGQNFNSVGILEISPIALEELVQNALIHRDYSKNSPIRLFIFDNRVEIISPGVLPNSLTIENIKAGNAVVRNNLMSSFCSKTMKYRGLGSGVKRAIREESQIDLINDIEGEQFIVKIRRQTN